MYGLNSAAGHLDTLWIERQQTPMSPGEAHTLLNPYLTPIGKIELPNLWLPSGIFVNYTPTGPDPSVAHGGGYYYRPSQHGFGATVSPGDSLDHIHTSVLARHEARWTRYALVGLTMSGNNPIDLYDQPDISYMIINTGAEPLRSGDTFMVEPPTQEHSKAQLECWARTIRAEGNFKNKTLLGGLPATVKVPAEMTSRMQHVMTRDVGLCVDVVTPGAGGQPQGLMRLYNNTNELGTALKSTVLATTLDALDSVSVLLTMMKRVAQLPVDTQDRLTEYYNFKMGREQPDPSLLIEVWRQPIFADLFMDSMEFGMRAMNRLKQCTVGSVIRSTEQNPTPIRGETMYNSYGGQYLTGESFYGTVHSFNGV